MGLNAGQRYERIIFRILDQQGKIAEGITRPEQIVGQDITVENQYGKSGIEIKLNESAAFGSGTLYFNHYSNNRSPWALTETDESDEENTSKEIMRSIAGKYRLTERVNREWYTNNGKYYPFYLEETKRTPSPAITRMSKRDRGKKDNEALPDITVKCSADDIIDYYTSKGSHYIHIGKKGLYWFGKEDPLNISSKISLFSPSNTYIRVRVQSKGGDNYRFAYELYAKRHPATNYDLERNPNVI